MSAMNEHRCLPMAVEGRYTNTLIQYNTIQYNDAMQPHLYVLSKFRNTLIVVQLLNIKGVMDLL